MYGTTGILKALVHLFCPTQTQAPLPFSAHSPRKSITIVDAPLSLPSQEVWGGETTPTNVKCLRQTVIKPPKSTPIHFYQGPQARQQHLLVSGIQGNKLSEQTFMPVYSHYWRKAPL